MRNAANWTVIANGTTNEYFADQNWTLTAGRVFAGPKEQADRSVCIIGNTVKTNLYPDNDPIETTLRVGSVSCEVIGVLAARGRSGFGDQDNTVPIPHKTVQRRLTGNHNVQFIRLCSRFVRIGDRMAEALEM